MGRLTGIAIRRHHRFRLRKARKNYWGREDGVVSEVVINTPQPVSSPFTRNQRRNKFLSKRLRMTIQERKALESFERL